MAEVKTPTKVITGPARLSYAHVWEPAAIGDSAEKKYSVALLIPKSDPKTVDAIYAAVEYLEAEFKAKNKGKLPAKWKTPVRDGDEEKPDDPAYAGHYFFNAVSKNKPQIVKAMAGKLVEITDEDEVYSGCYARVSVNFYTFDVNGNKGIAAGLNNILKVKDGDRLAGGASAEEDFGDLVAELSDSEDFDNDPLA
jgi:hypothetical protein